MVFGGRPGGGLTEREEKLFAARRRKRGYLGAMIGLFVGRVMLLLIPAGILFALLPICLFMMVVFR